MRLWNLKDRTQEAVLQGHIDSVISVAITSNSKYIVFCGNDETVRIWNLSNEIRKKLFLLI